MSIFCSRPDDWLPDGVYLPKFVSKSPDARDWFTCGAWDAYDYGQMAFSQDTIPDCAKSAWRAYLAGFDATVAAGQHRKTIRVPVELQTAAVSYTVSGSTCYAVSASSYTVADIARMSGVSESTIRHKIINGTIQTEYSGHGVTVSSIEVENAIKDGRLSIRNSDGSLRKNSRANKNLLKSHE